MSNFTEGKTARGVAFVGSPINRGGVTKKSVLIRLGTDFLYLNKTLLALLNLTTIQRCWVFA